MGLRVVPCASVATAVNCRVAPGAIDPVPGLTVTVNAASNAGIVAVVFWPATTFTPDTCAVYATPPPRNPCSAIVYGPGSSLSIVTVAPGVTGAGLGVG